jgi:predicted nucleotidyltransferase component of viral defense system
MTFNFSKHKEILLQMLKDIYTDVSIAPHLGFQGGTAALLFYGLNRNSVDLDFDLLDEDKRKVVFEKMQIIASKYGRIVDSHIKRFNLVIVVAHDLKSQNIKIEVNRRNFGANYVLKTLLGIGMLVMTEEDMFANKLMALHERVGKASRDIYDTWFFLEHRWPINPKIIEERARVSLPVLLEKCIAQLEKMNNRHILDGIGELLTDSQKDWARAKLLSETIFLLKARLESER